MNESKHQTTSISSEEKGRGAAWNLPCMEQKELRNRSKFRNTARRQIQPRSECFPEVVATRKKKMLKFLIVNCFPSLMQAFATFWVYHRVKSKQNRKALAAAAEAWSCCCCCCCAWTTAAIAIAIAIGMVMIIAAVTGETIARPSIVRRHPYRRHFPRMPWLVFRLSVVGVGVAPWSKTKNNVSVF